MSDEPNFTRSCYATDADLYKAKAAYYEAKVEELTEWNGISIGLKCPACDDVGWYVAFNGEQEQCEFCYTCPDSIFNRKAALTGE